MSDLWAEALKQFAETIDNGGYEDVTIPEGTTAKATVHKFGEKTTMYVLYKLQDGDFKGQTVYQRLKLSDTGVQGKMDREHLLKLYSACCLELPKSLPGLDTLANLEGSPVGLKLGHWVANDGSARNCVRNLSKASGHFMTRTGEAKVADESKSDSGAVYDDWMNSTKPKEVAKDDGLLDDDVPF